MGKHGERCRAITARGTPCKGRAIQGGFCKRHIAMAARQQYREEDKPKTQEQELMEEFSNSSSHEIVTYVDNSTCGRVKLNIHMPHDVLVDQAIEALL